MLNCAKCGHIVHETARTCPQCGAPPPGITDPAATLGAINLKEELKKEHVRTAVGMAFLGFLLVLGLTLLLVAMAGTGNAVLPVVAIASFFIFVASLAPRWRPWFIATHKDSAG